MLLTGLAFHCAALAAPADAEPDAAVKIGAASPALELPDLDGKVRKVPAAKKTILAFIASWSKPCQAELIDLQEIHQAADGSLEVIAVSFDKKIKDLKAFASKNRITFPILLDKKLASLDRFQILILPTTFCINSDGIIENIFIDYDENVKKALEAWQKSS